MFSGISYCNIYWHLELLGQGHEQGEILVGDGDLAEVHEVDQGGEVLEPHVVRHDQHLGKVE